MASCSSQGVALVTGYNGFTGRYLGQRLEAAGYHVVGLVRRQTATLGAVVADLCLPDQVNRAVAQIRPDVVVHLAGISFVDHADVAAIYHANILGARNLLTALALLDRPPRAVLLASSANVYGNAQDDADARALDESTLPAPANDYAVSKLAMEYMSRIWMEQLPITLVRPFNYTGVGQSLNFVLPKIVDHFRRRAPKIELGNMDVFRDFSDVRTVAEAYCRLAAKAPAGEVVNVSSGMAYSLAMILDMLTKISGHTIQVLTSPGLMRPNEVRRLVGSAEKLHRLVGPLPPIPLAETLRWMYEARS